MQPHRMHPLHANIPASLGLLRRPIPQPGEEFPIIQYADDTLLILKADAMQLFFLKGILQSFSLQGSR
jgi:hypothetical protein